MVDGFPFLSFPREGDSGASLLPSVAISPLSSAFVMAIPASSRTIHNEKGFDWQNLPTYNETVLTEFDFPLSFRYFCDFGLLLPIKHIEYDTAIFSHLIRSNREVPAREVC